MGVEADLAGEGVAEAGKRRWVTGLAIPVSTRRTTAPRVRATLCVLHEGGGETLALEGGVDGEAMDDEGGLV